MTHKNARKEQEDNKRLEEQQKKGEEKGSLVAALTNYAGALTSLTKSLSVK